MVIINWAGKASERELIAKLRSILFGLSVRVRRSMDLRTRSDPIPLEKTNTPFSTGGIQANSLRRTWANAHIQINAKRLLPKNQIHILKACLFVKLPLQ